MAAVVHQDNDATVPGGTLAATADELIATALGVKAERDEALHLLRRVLQLREIGDQGEYKTTVRAFLARIGSPEILSRFDRQRAIERSIGAFNPDTIEALELLHAIAGSMKDRYGEDRTTDLMKCFNEAEEALSEIEAATS